MKTFLLVLLGITSAAASEPSLTVKRLSDNVYELLLVTDRTADVSAAQHAIWPAAQQLCAEKTPRFGHYKFQSAEPMPGQPTAHPEITLRQEVHCEPASAPLSGAKNSPVVAHDDAAIDKLTKTYLAAKGAGKYAEAYALLGPSMKASTSLESWSANARNIDAKAGKVNTRRVKKITWYDNPQSAPVPGTYAAADYEIESENARVYCGYVAWFGAADGPFTIVREEENFIDKDTALKLSAERLNAFARQFGCEVR